MSKKYLLKQAAKSYLPSEILEHKKQGFAAPMTSWIKNDLRKLVNDRLSVNELKIHDLFNHSYIQKKIDEHMNDREINDKFIFSLLMFQSWHEKYIN